VPDAPRPPQTGTVGVAVQGIAALIGGAPIVLAGAAFAAAGPGALAALLANFALAAAGAFALSDLAGRFRRSGGVFMFAQRVLGPESGFAIGWATLLGSLTAAALFALGFATFATSLAAAVAAAVTPDPPTALTAGGTRVAVALATSVALGMRIARRLRRPPALLTAAKVIGMAGIGAVGLLALPGNAGALDAFLAEPPFPGGLWGILQAMGIMFVAFQGVTTLFGNSAEVRDPARTLPRASLAALAVATAL
jgi:APA family basic amino acid/polyamine antiporter